MSWGELRAHGSEKGVSSEWRCRSGNGISRIEGSSESVKVWNELPAEPGMKRSKSCGTADTVLNHAEASSSQKDGTHSCRRLLLGLLLAGRYAPPI